MYFQAFQGRQRSPLVPDLTYIVERLVSQLLATAGAGALDAALQEDRLVEMLVGELSFHGQIPRVHLPEIREYLMLQEPALKHAAQRLVCEPENEVFRHELCSPQRMTVV
jgi:hypothetical protein